MTAPSDLAATLAIIGDHAARLRESGVLELTVDGLTIKLAPAQLPALVMQPPAPHVDPFDDPTTYGLPPGSTVPGLEWFAEAQAQRNKDLGR